MASISLPVVTATDQLSMRIEDSLELILAACQSAGQVSDAAGKNATMKIGLQAMSDALDAWVVALDAQIATL